MPGYDEPTNPNLHLGAIPQRANTGAYSVPYQLAYGGAQPPPAAPPPPSNGGYLPYDNSRVLKLWQVLTGFTVAAITITGAGFTFASHFFVTQEAQNKANVLQAVTNSQLQTAVTENSRTAERLERAIEKLSERIEKLNMNDRDDRRKR